MKIYKKKTVYAKEDGKIIGTARPVMEFIKIESPFYFPWMLLPDDFDKLLEEKGWAVM